ncbi:DinB family protein [Rubrivirga sp. IMCC45206]|uniref:DinB family protein n=1 Tax=Rubrivirga sp. IMCC45206 TaxID=3391614 RepID=UPI00398FEC1C
MTRRARLLAGLDAHRAAFSARLDGLPDAVVHTRPAPGAWSLAQLAEHLLLIDGGLTPDGPPAGPLARATSGVRSAGIRAVLSLPARIPAPPSAQAVMPSPAPRWPDVRRRWAALRAGWREWGPRAGTVAFRHPLAGPFLPDDALAFLLAHHRHHDAQVRRTLAGLAREEE